MFIKTNKTAGTSVEIALSRFCGPDDVITPVSKTDEIKRKELGGSGPQNCYAPLGAYGARDWLRLLFRFKRKLKYYNHISAADVRDLVSAETWDTYYKFCIVRNPWDRFLSFYYWQNRKQTKPSLSEFMASEKMQLFRERGVEAYTDNSGVIVDELIRYEDIDSAFQMLQRKFGIDPVESLPFTKNKTRKNRGSYKDEFSQEDAQLLANLVSDELKITNYEF